MLDKSEGMRRLLASCDSDLERVVAQKFLDASVRIERGSRSIVGRPDFQITGAEVLIFVHGCYWHRHSCSAGRRTPKTDVLYWTGVFGKQVERDRSVVAKLRRDGWRVWVIWECEVDKLESGRVSEAKGLIGSHLEVAAG